MNTINKEALEHMQTSGRNPVVVNVLPNESFAKEHIPQSLNIPLERDDFVQRVEKAANGKERDVVVYCASEQCDASPKAARKLEAAGFTKVHDFAGGLEEWKQAGRPVESGARA